MFRDSQMMAIWRCNILLKVKNFIWLANHDRIKSGVQLKKKKWLGPVECATCDKTETSDHVLFQCPIAIFLWAFLRDTFGWQRSPTSCSEFLVEFVDRTRGKNQQVLIFVCAGALWTIWKTRNDVAINKKVLLSPMTIIHKTLMLIKSWRPMLKTKL